MSEGKEEEEEGNEKGKEEEGAEGKEEKGRGKV